jgi:ribosomal protein S18 acetylase RimI-like enzyme
VIAAPRSTRPAIRAAGGEDLHVLAHVLVEAFLHGDLAGWLIPHLDTRHRTYQRYFAMLAEHALDHGQVDVTADGHACALWYPIDGGPPPLPVDYDARLAQITGPAYRRFAALDAALYRHHPYYEPHHHLAYLAVHPDAHGRGYGTALLRHHHADLDRNGIPAYVEATGVRNRRLYTRHGYRPRTPIPITATGPCLYPMWRPPTEPDVTISAAAPPALPGSPARGARRAGGVPSLMTDGGPPSPPARLERRAHDV